MNIKQNIETVNKIRKLLLAEWDPLNIGENPNLSDEYDGYIPVILRALITDIEVDELSKVLYKIETDEIGIDGDKDRCFNVSVMLKKMN